MTGPAGRFPGDGAGPGHPGLLSTARTVVKHLRRKLCEDKGSPGNIMARAESQRQLEHRQLLELLLAHLRWGDEE